MCTTSKENMSLQLVTEPRGYNYFFMLNSIEHEIYHAHKC